MARGAKARGKRIAFGDGKRIRWDKNSDVIFRGNPNIAPPGSERDRDIQWIPFFKGHRIYNRQARNRWVWNPHFKAVPGEVFLDPVEVRNGARLGGGFIVMEPLVELWKTASINKDWGFERYQTVADDLVASGHRVIQFHHPSNPRQLDGVEKVKASSFRDALAILSHAVLYIGAEGGLHHGAAAAGVKGVVLFGGFIPPSVTGYDIHTNLTGGAKACGYIVPCKHCKDAMSAIRPDDVLDAAWAYL